MTARLESLLAIAALAAAGVACGWFDGPERQIRRTLDDVADRLSHRKPVNGLGAAAAAAGLREYLAPDVVLEAGPGAARLDGRDAVVAAAARLVAATPALEVEFVDVRVSLEAGAGDEALAAKVTCSVLATTEDRAGERTREVRELALTMRRSEGRWTIARVATVDVLEPVT